MAKKVVVLVSGMDSMVALQKARTDFPNDEVIGVYYNMGQPFSKAEMSKLPKDIVIRPFEGYLEMLPSEEVDGYIYYPDLFEGILYDAIRTYRPDILWLGVLHTDSRYFPDNGLPWVDRFNDKFPRTNIDYPLARMGLGKKQVIEYGLSLGLKARTLIKMHHCRSKFYGKHGCGSCFSCMRKKSTFEEMGYKTRIPTPKEMPTSLLDYQVANYADNEMRGVTTAAQFAYMEEILPLLEKEYGVKNNIVGLAKAVNKDYLSKKHVVGKLMEDYDE